MLCMDQYARVIHYHPHQYTHFNRFIGGLEGAVGRYSTDYYAESYSEATARFADKLYQAEPDVFLNTTYSLEGCGGSFRTLRRVPANFRWRDGRSDFRVVYSRQKCDTKYPRAPIAYEHRRDGGRLVIVRDLRWGRVPPSRDRPERKETSR